MKFVFCINIILDNMAGVLRGAIKSLAIQNQIVAPHFICQGLLSNIFTYYFGFVLYPGDMMGIWIAKTLVALCLLGSYLVVLARADWEKESRKAVEMQNSVVSL